MSWLKRWMGGAPQPTEGERPGVDARYAAACERIAREDYEGARAELERLRDEAPDSPQVHASLAHVQRHLGQIEEAIAGYRRVLELRPDDAQAHSHLLLTLNYGVAPGASAIFDEHRRYGLRHAQPVVAPVPAAGDRPLRVGYLSPDFHAHVVASFLLPVLARHDRARFEVYCYHTGDRQDAVTGQMRALAAHWRDCAAEDDEAIARRIRADGIDLLVDLAGHMPGGRPGVLARRPAPLQATYLGYPNTTGLAAVDLRFTDAIADPPGEADRLHVERLVRLPRGFLCYRPGPELGPVPPPPSARSGAITFGCFNNFQKLSDPFFDAAARLLNEVPGSRLLLKAKPLMFASVRARVAARFAAAGIGPERLLLRGWEARVTDHLGAYDDVDIALDSFPYNGTTTTCEASWMGVPVVTVRGDRHAGRVGASLLHALGLDELVAEDAYGYVRIAAGLARDGARLASLRAGLRERMRRSPLMDESGFVADLERAYEAAWQARVAVGATVLDQDPAQREAVERHWARCNEAQDPVSALGRLGAAIAADPGVAAFHYMIGCTYEDLERPREAIASYRRALELEPGHAKAANNLGAQLEVVGEVQEARAAYERALQSDPKLPNALANLAGLIKRRGDPVEALPLLERLVALEPESAEHRCSQAEACILAWKLDEGEAASRAAIALDPGHMRAHFCLGNALQMLGRAEEGAAAFREALRLDPGFDDAHSNLLLCLHYRHGDEPRALYEAHLEWDRIHGAALAQPAPAATPAEGRPLRIGYLSPNFHRHSVAFFLEPLLAAHDRSAFRVHAYANVANPDKVTARLQGLCDAWCDASAMSDEDLVRRIRADGIDILVDLAGHTGGGRMRVLARKPAPVQVNWLGYPNTTGLSAMDWRLTDARADPPGESDLCHSERLLRLEHGFLCYAPLENAPPVGVSPAAAAGHVTFGSFNNLAKVTPETLALWARIVAAVPGSRFLFKAHGAAAASAQRALREAFAAQGVAADRLTLVGAEPAVKQHLARYHEVDVALDTFPYHGTTTTCEALWMGVPVVTRAGRAHVSRVGVSLLQQVGLGELVAADAEDYVGKAVALARDGGRLAQLRAGLRERMRASPLMDAKGFARRIEDAYREMWRRREGEPMKTVESTSGDGLRLHLGGREARAGWKILNVQPGPAVDYVGDCVDLSRFKDGEAEEIYASHVLEHLAYQQRLPRALREIHRVLRPGGRVLISVPDFEVLCRLFLDPVNTPRERFEIMRMAFGGQMDEHDFHTVGLTEEILGRFLAQAGFRELQRVERFGLFEDTSDLRVRGRLISLNLIAWK